LITKQQSQHIAEQFTYQQLVDYLEHLRSFVDLLLYTFQLTHIS